MLNTVLAVVHLTRNVSEARERGSQRVKPSPLIASDPARLSAAKNIAEVAPRPRFFAALSSDENRPSAESYLWRIPEKLQRGAGCQPAKTAADWQSAPRSHVAILLERAIYSREITLPEGASHKWCLSPFSLRPPVPTLPHALFLVQDSPPASLAQGAVSRRLARLSGRQHAALQLSAAVEAGPGRDGGPRDGGRKKLVRRRPISRQRQR